MWQEAHKTMYLKIISSCMLAIALFFIFFALMHPELHFPWRNEITYTLYFLYALVTFALLFAAFKKSK